MTANNVFEKFKSDYPGLADCFDDVFSAFKLIHNCYLRGGKVLICGNGGSASDSEHIVGELMKGFNLKRPLTSDEKRYFEGIEGGSEIAAHLQRALPAISLVSQTSLITAFMNDVDPSLVFAQQVFAYAEKEDDVLIALSTSGNSANIINAAKTARAKGIKTISITGENASSLTAFSDVCIRVPRHTPYEVQELTLPIYHALCAMVEAEMFDE